MVEFDFLSNEQIYGRKKLEIFDKIGTKCKVTDFSILLGGSGTYNVKTKNLNYGSYWTKSTYDNNIIEIINNDGLQSTAINKARCVDIRPIIDYSLIKNNFCNKEFYEKDVKEIYYGEYPQSIVNKDFSESLELAYTMDVLEKTGKIYTTDSVYFSDTEIPFQKKEHLEYKYNGKKYIRFVAQDSYLFKNLSDGREVKKEEVYWINVEPIAWVIDEKTNIAITKKLLIGGLQYNYNDVDAVDFMDMDIKKYLDCYFSKEIVNLKEDVSTDYNINNNTNNKKKIKRKNAYDLIFDDVSEEEIIKGALLSDVPVFLHGAPGEGKSARVKQFDPDCEIIYLRNMTLDGLNGKTIYDSINKEMIDCPPNWYKKIKNKCENKPNKLHILFFDEITNALPSIQGMAFNIVLDKEINGIWKLPKNCRIVAAGNDLSDSLAANAMAEPLFSRFAHVYINTDIISWLKWASTNNEQCDNKLDYVEEEKNKKIHPSIYAYLAYKANKGQDVLRTEYNGEKPNADPRKWEMASKMLYKTKNPKMLRSLIGNALTKEFTKFCKIKVLTIEEVLSGQYTYSDIEIDISQKYVTAIGLSAVDEDNLIIVRDFVKNLGNETLALFDTLWCHEDKKRLEKIALLKLGD